MTEALFEVSEQNGEVRFAVRVQPRASRTSLEGVRDGALLVRLTVPPVEGEANEALVTLLASRLNVPKSAVRILSGEHGRNKRVEISGVTRQQILDLLRVEA